MRRFAIGCAALWLVVARPAPARADDAGKDAAVAARDDRTTDTRDRQSPRTDAQCIDQELADRLSVKRQRRGAVDRLFIKHGRHELSAMGGYYVSDLYASTYVAGGSYTYHMTETTAVEFHGAWTHANAGLIRQIEADRGRIIDDDFARVIFGESLLVFSPIYGKLQFGGTIMRFDVHIDAGVGVVDAQTSRGASGVGGLGVKLFLGKAMALRIDARDRVFKQELLDEQFIVNDVSVTLGLSLFLPVRL